MIGDRGWDSEGQQTSEEGTCLSQEGEASWLPPLHWGQSKGLEGGRSPASHPARPHCLTLRYSSMGTDSKQEFNLKMEQTPPASWTVLQIQRCVCEMLCIPPSTVHEEGTQHKFIFSNSYTENIEESAPWSEGREMAQRDGGLGQRGAGRRRVLGPEDEWVMSPSGCRQGRPWCCEGPRW